MTGTRATYAGITLTVPAGWDVVHHGPSECGSVIGQTAYFFRVLKDAVPPACPQSSGAPTSPYIVVACDPPEPQPQGLLSQVGPFRAFVISSLPRPGDYAGLPTTYIYLVGRKTTIDIAGSLGLTQRIEASIGGADGGC